jgi:hypothetical protein
VDWERVTLAVPDVQESAAVPPELLDAIVRSYVADVSVKFPPVELDSVTITLVAFTWSASATEPAKIVNVVAGELRETVSAVIKLSGAARAIAKRLPPRTVRIMKMKGRRAEW